MSCRVDDDNDVKLQLDKPYNSIFAYTSIWLPTNALYMIYVINSEWLKTIKNYLKEINISIIHPWHVLVSTFTTYYIVFNQSKLII
jgi:hypothetical protein